MFRVELSRFEPGMFILLACLMASWHMAARHVQPSDRFGLLACGCLWNGSRSGPGLRTLGPWRGGVALDGSFLWPGGSCPHGPWRGVVPRKIFVWPLMGLMAASHVFFFGPGNYCPAGPWRGEVPWYISCPTGPEHLEGQVPNITRRGHGTSVCTILVRRYLHLCHCHQRVVEWGCSRRRNQG